MPTWLKVVLGIAVVLGVFVGGLVWFLVGITSVLIEPIDRQIAALKAGDMAAAYAETSEAFHKATPLEGFTAFVDGNPILRDIASRSFPNRSINNGVGTVSGSLTSSTGGVMPIEYRLVKENEIWKILYINLNGK